jgi:hypothetical protein
MACLNGLYPTKAGKDNEKLDTKNCKNWLKTDFWKSLSFVYNVIHLHCHSYLESFIIKKIIFLLWFQSKSLLKKVKKILTKIRLKKTFF